MLSFNSLSGINFFKQWSARVSPPYFIHETQRPNCFFHVSQIQVYFTPHHYLKMTLIQMMKLMMNLIRMPMSNLIFSSCSCYVPSMNSSCCFISIFLYTSHLKSCPRGLKNPHQAFSLFSHFNLWSHSGFQLPHPNHSDSGVNSLCCHLLHQT